MVIMIVAKFHQSKKEIQDDLKSARSQFVSKKAKQISHLWVKFWETPILAGGSIGLLLGGSFLYFLFCIMPRLLR